jgi:hypothetical protein
LGNILKGKIMELIKNGQTRSTPHYWGYRELSADELLCVGGGEDGGGGADGGGFGGGNYGGYSGGGYSASGGWDANSYYSPNTSGAQMATAIDLGMTDPIMAGIMFLMTLWGMSDGQSSPPNGNPMGDLSGGGG